MIKFPELGMIRAFAHDAKVITTATLSSLADIITSASERAGNVVEKVSESAGKAVSSFSKLLENTADAAKKAASALGALSVVKDLVAILAGDATRPVIGSSIKKGPDVVYLQQCLNKLMNANLKEDGIIGPKTTAAIQNFQRANGLASDGVVGPKTWAVIDAKMGVSTPENLSPNPPVSTQVPPAATVATPISQSAHSTAVVQMNDKNMQVTQLQSAINKLGYVENTGKPALIVDGVYGPKTQDGVLWAQKFVGMEATGIVDSQTFNAILSSATKMVGPSSNATPDAIAKAAVDTNVVTGTYPLEYAQAIISGDSTGKVMTQSRFKSATASDVSSGFLLEAVITQVKQSASPNFFKFFSLLNPFLPAILRALAYHETSVRNAAVGQAGEISIFQLLPKTVVNLKKLYGLPDLNISNAASLSAYILALLKDIDGAAGSYISRSIGGAMNAGTLGNDQITAVLAKLPSSPALISQLTALFMVYNAGYADKFWAEDWRAQEAYKRTLSVILAAGGY